MTFFHLDMFQTAGLGVLALGLGAWLTGKVKFLRRYCVPSPVSGGILFSLLILALHGFCGIELSFDGTLKDAFMLAFFTSIGFQGDFKLIKSGGRPLAVMLGLVAVLVAVQNLVPLGISRLMGVDPLVGIAAGSVSMTGGHGTAGGFASILEEMGLEGAETVAMAAATFGLVAGGLVGGPLAQRLVSRKMGGCWNEDAAARSDAQTGAGEDVKAAGWIVLVMAGGTVVSRLLSKTGIVFPTYFGALLLAVIVRNVVGALPGSGNWMPVERIGKVGNVCLMLFLGMAMVSLRLWELASLALPLCVMLFAQVVVMVLFGYFVAFRALGRDYDAAVMVSGLCGFGLGATPNAMANMGAVCDKYGYSAKAFLVVPIVGAMFADLINTGIITVFLNFIR